MMEKAFDAAAAETRWRERWERLGVGHADAGSGRKAFTIALPPPNITGALHCGHAAGFSVQDTLARYRRMCGDEVEWTPGTDHAAIATNAVIERQLAAEGTTKEELGKPAFLSRVDAWYEEYGGRIYDQMGRLGFTCDWSRSRFTLDDAYVRTIRVVFKELFDEGLIYRGPRIVNWCPHDRSAISDEEIEWVEHVATLTHLRYPVEGGEHITVATVRPETMLGDTAVAVSPDDPRYSHLIGKTVTLPLTGRVVPIIADVAVRPEFGTGALKVTPAHDPTDYDIALRHSLPMISVIAPDGTMDVPQLPVFHGTPADAARPAVTEALRAIGVVVKEEPYTHEVGHCDRCHHLLEPQISAQWWVRMETLAQPGIAAVEKGEIRFHPARYTDVYLTWMGNIRDWCISRQIWLGHSIPVSSCAGGHTFAWVDQPAQCPMCGSSELVHDPDVLDTWFSSALWPFAIYGWPEKTEDLERFYPTDVLVTARDIIFLWVARMIMAGLRFTGERPFSDVIITATVQAQDGSRMNKSRGNAIDPLEMIDRYGADAVRAWAAAVGTGGQDSRFDEKRIESYKFFANKIWNATRFLVTRLGDGEHIPGQPPMAPEELLAEDRWMLGRVADCAAVCDRALSNYRFHEAVDALYDTIKHDFCDTYVEMIQPRLRHEVDRASRDAAASTAITSLDILIRLLHPFMPFVTEECAQRLPDVAETLQRRSWPQPPGEWRAGANVSERAAVGELLELVQRLRAARQEHGVADKDRTAHPVVIRGGASGISDADRLRLLHALLPWSRGDAAAGTGIPVVAGAIEATLHIGAAAESPERRARQLRDVEARIARLRAQVDDPQFVERARADVVEKARRQLGEAEQQAQTLRRRGEAA
ncbi:MAG: valine--tRNA ligase [Candidatus Dormibacteria bacterium]